MTNSNNVTEFKDKVETKIISLWHNMKYGWNTKVRSNFNKESAVWVLGRCYHQKVTPSPSMQASVCEMFDSPTTSNLINKNLDNKLLTMSLHEELPTSCDSYLQKYSGTKCRSTNDLDNTMTDNDIDQAFEPPEETGQDVAGDYEEGFDGFKRDFISRIWMTYRRDFAIMQTDLKEPTGSPTSYTSDCGWGCMIRSGQMLLAQSLVVHFLGRSWRFDPNSQIATTTEDHIHRKIIRWFGDQESKSSPFSIHKMVEFGKRNGKKVGEWYGPGSVAHVLKEAVKQAAKDHIDLASLHVYVAQDCTVYNQDIFDECYSQEIQSNVPWQSNKPKSLSATCSPRKKNVITWKHLILLIPLRLGNEKLNPIYADCLKAMLSLEWCIGIIGGRPKHSLYFVGYQDDKLIHLDPHYCQELVDVNIEHFPVTSFHCRSARKMKISKMDPSCCIGFYIPTRNEYDRFQNTIQQYLQPVRNYTERHRATQSAASCLRPPNILNDQSCYPMFIFQPGRLRDETNKKSYVQSSARNTPAYLNVDEREADANSDTDDGIEDFVIL